MSLDHLELDVDAAWELLQQDLRRADTRRRRSWAGGIAAGVAVAAVAVAVAWPDHDTRVTTATEPPVTTPDTTTQLVDQYDRPITAVDDLFVEADPVQVAAGDDQRITVRLRNDGKEPVEVGVALYDLTSVISDTSGHAVGGSYATGHLAQGVDHPPVPAGGSVEIGVEIDAVGFGGPSPDYPPLAPGRYLLWVELGSTGDGSQRVTRPIPMTVTSTGTDGVESAAQHVPRVWLFPTTGSGEQAVLSGTLAYDSKLDCLFLEESGEAVVWPAGTVGTADGPGVVLPTGVTARVGDRISGGGGHQGGNASTYGIAPECVTESLAVFQFNDVSVNP